MNLPPSPQDAVSAAALSVDTVTQKDNSLANFYSSISLTSSPSSSSYGYHHQGSGGGRGVLGQGEGVEDDDPRPSTPRNASSPLLLAGEGIDGSIEGNHDDLLVFGYGCKVFRDNERAQWVEEERHLIPWMGNPNLLIDRYDCRGALVDISRFEPGSRSSSSRQEEVTSGQQQQLQFQTDDNVGDGVDDEVDEEELDAERFRDLNENEDYDEDSYYTRGEAEYKRLRTLMNGMVSESIRQGGGGIADDGSKNYAAFQYDYDQQSQDVCIGPEPKRLQEEDALYVKPVGLYIPEEIALPQTMKSHAIIEKTAKFIASQGNQMEIILKTKQAGNALFDFLNHSGKLNPYYKFMVHAIRTGIYRPPATEENTEYNPRSPAQDCSGSEEDADHHTYLHPSLFRPPPTTSLMQMDSISSAYSSNSSSSRHNAYSMLVSKIRGAADSPDSQQPATNSLAGSQMTSSSVEGGIFSNYGYPVQFGGQVQLPPQFQTQAQHHTQRPQKQLPSTQDQLIIEKMASYVIKNGTNFEVLANNKGDPRFDFLNPMHEYHWYYLNCKERFKAETSAVVASSEFVNYVSKGSSGGTQPNASTSMSNITTSSSSSVRKSVAVELAELKKKQGSGLLPLVKKDKSGSTGGSSSPSVVVPPESVFSQANFMVKEKDKPVIRFSSSLSSNLLPKSEPITTATTILNHVQPPALDTSTAPPTLHASSSSSLTMEENHSGNTRGGVDDDDEGDGGNDDDDDHGCPFDDTGGGSTPASDDEEQTKRRLERKRKAALFLQTLKMKTSTTQNAVASKLHSNKVQDSQPSSRNQPSSSISVPGLVVTGTSLGDLLHRFQAAGETPQEKGLAFPSPTSTPVTIDITGDVDRVAEDFNNGTKSSSSSRHSSRSRSRTARKAQASSRRRSRHRSYSSSASESSGDGRRSPHYSKKKSKRKHKKKKKRHGKSRSSSRKSKRRK